MLAVIENSENNLEVEMRGRDIGKSLLMHDARNGLSALFRLLKVQNTHRPAKSATAST